MEIPFDIVEAILNGETFIDQFGKQINKDTLKATASQGPHKIFVDDTRYNQLFYVPVITRFTTTLGVAVIVVLSPRSFTFLVKKDAPLLPSTPLVNTAANTAANQTFQPQFQQLGAGQQGYYQTPSQNQNATCPVTGQPLANTNCASGGTFGGICNKELPRSHQQNIAQGEADQTVIIGTTIFDQTFGYFGLEILSAIFLFFGSLICFQRSRF